jgi:hypothetical protein
MHYQSKNLFQLNVMSGAYKPVKNLKEKDERDLYRL